MTAHAATTRTEVQVTIRTFHAEVTCVGMCGSCAIEILTTGLARRVTLMFMRTLVLFVMTACGGGGMDMEPTSDATSRDDARGPGVDAPPPNTSHRGLVQVARLDTGTQISVGFYRVPDGSAGCTWTFLGACSLAVCADDAGLVAASAGTVTFSLDATTKTVTPDADGRYPPASAAAAPGTSVQASAAGAADVPSFTSSSLVLPEPLAVSAPANGGVLTRSDPLTVTWTPVPGEAYVTVSQAQIASPFPASHARTIRCDVSSQTGSLVVPVELLAALQPGIDASITVAAQATERRDAGPYEVQTRLLALDSTRRLSVQ